PPLGVAPAQRRRDELLEQRRLASRRGAERAQVARRDAVPRELRAGRGDVRVGVGIALVAARPTGREQAVVLQLLPELRRDAAAQPPDDLADAEQALARRMLLVRRRLRHAMNVIRYFPTCSSSPSSSVTRSMRLRFTNVPFSEPWSSTTKWPFSSIRTAWLRE